MRRVVLLFILTFLTESHVVLAQRASVVSVDVMHVPSRGIDRESQHYFAGEIMTLPLVIYGYAKDAVDVKAQLYYRTASSLAMAGEPMTTLSQRELPGQGILHYDFSMTLPDVKRASDMQLNFFAKTVQEKEWHTTGEFPLKVYPNNLLDPVRAWAQEQPVRLDDPQGKLREFLDAQKIPYLESKAVSLKGLKQPRVILRTGRPKHEEPLAKDEIVVHFKEEEEGLPAVIVEPFGLGIKVDVQMKLIDELKASAQAQATFLEIINLVNEQIYYEQQEGRSGK